MIKAKGSVIVAITVVMTPVVAVATVPAVLLALLALLALDRGGVGGGVGGGVTASSDGSGIGDPCTGVAGDVDLQHDGRVAVSGRQDVRSPPTAPAGTLTVT